MPAILAICSEGQAAPKVSDDHLALLQRQHLKFRSRGFGIESIRMRARCYPPETRSWPQRLRTHGVDRRPAAVAALIAPLRTTRNSQAAGLSGKPPCPASFRKASCTTSSGVSHHCRA